MIMPELLWLRQAMDETENRIQSFSKAAGVTETLRQTISGAMSGKGKRYRPMLLLLCAGEPRRWRCKDEVITLAAAVELTHTASLIHDDIVDDAPIRRGLPTAQSKYGKHNAVYAGDYLLSETLRNTLARGFCAGTVELLSCVWRMCEGEIVQMSNRWNTEVGLEAYIKAISGKTAALFETACRLGAQAGNKSPDEVEAMAKCGRDLGILFQLNDDLNDWTLSAENSGKAVNMDFLDGIFTYPAISTFSDRAKGNELRELADLVKSRGPSAELANRARELVKSAGGISRCEETMEDYCREVILGLSRFQGDKCAEMISACAQRLCTGRSAR